MKKNYLLGLFLAMAIVTISAVVLSIVVSASKSQRISYNDISVNSFLSFISTDTTLKNDSNLQSLSSIDITQKYDNDGNNIYFAEATPQLMWGSELYIVSVDDNKITKITDAGLGGNSEYFSYDVVTMTQGVFISAFCASHSGNGELELALLPNPNIKKYTIPGAVDNYYEDSRLTAAEYSLASTENGDITASAVYLGGKLHADYTDINHDGDTDVVLTGIQQIYETGIHQEQIPRKEYYVKDVYLYDSIKDDFLFDEKASELVLIHSY